MTDLPQKLFATTAERFPQPDDTDTSRKTLEGIVESVPFFGRATTLVFSTWFIPAIEKRREEWFKELADAVDEIREKVEGFNVENLKDNEAFVTAVFDATRIAIATHQHEKRQMLRNALINIAVGKGPKEDLQLAFLNAIDAFTPSHVKVLNILWNPHGELAKAGIQNQLGVEQYRFNNFGVVIGAIVPDLKGQDGFVHYIISDLRNRGFTNLSGPGASYPQSPAITNLGIEFLNFIQSA